MGGLKAWAAAAVLVGAASAEAQTMTLEERRAPVGTVARDALWGGLAGAALGGGFVGYQAGLGTRGEYDWKPVLVTGVAIGLGAGLLWGLARAMSAPHHGAPNGPVSDGMALSAQRPSDLSGQFTAPIAFGHF
jgi:hypothetical protein